MPLPTIGKDNIEQRHVERQVTSLALYSDVIMLYVAPQPTQEPLETFFKI